jgi:antitoxin ParD1/3/4
MPIKRQSRNVSLTPDLASFVDERVASGRYGTASEVVRAGLRLLERAEGEAPSPSSPTPRPAAPRADR